MILFQKNPKRNLTKKKKKTGLLLFDVVGLMGSLSLRIGYGSDSEYEGVTL